MEGKFGRKHGISSYYVIFVHQTLWVCSQFVQMKAMKQMVQSNQQQMLTALRELHANQQEAQAAQKEMQANQQEMQTSQQEMQAKDEEMRPNQQGMRANQKEIQRDIAHDQSAIKAVGNSGATYHFKIAEIA